MSYASKFLIIIYIQVYCAQQITQAYLYIQSYYAGS